MTNDVGLEDSSIDIFYISVIIDAAWLVDGDKDHCRQCQAEMCNKGDN